MNRRVPVTFLNSHSAAVGSVFITLLALVIRVAGLSLDSLWFDEIFSVRAARMGIGEIISLTRGDVHPPLYYLLLHFWIRLFGETEAAVRMLSVLFSILTVFVLYHLAVKLFNRPAPFFAALFAALSPFHLFYAQETRMYAQLSFLSAASVYFFVSWLKEGGRVMLALYVISTTLLLYTHIYGSFVVAAQFLYFVLLFFRARGTFEKKWRGWLIAQMVTGLLFLPWVLVILQQATRARRGFWIRDPDWLAPLSTLIEYCGSLWPALFLLPLFGYGIKRCCGNVGGKRSGGNKDESLPQAGTLLLLWLLLPILIPFLLSKLVTPFYLPKYTIAASLPFYLFAARGLAEVEGRVRRAALLLLICIFFGVGLSREVATLKRERWHDAAYNIEQQARAGDLLLFNSTGSYMSFAYYASRKDLPAAVFPYAATDEQSPGELALLRRVAAEGFGTVHEPQTEEETATKLKKIVGERKRVWVVTRYGEGFKDDFMRAFGGEFRPGAQPALCFQQQRFLFTENYSEASSAIFLQQRGESCTPQVYLLERD